MEAFVALVTVFVLAIFVGFEVITKVPPTLHTPLMSGSNAISGITIIGALILAGRITEGYPQLARVMATVAVAFAGAPGAPQLAKYMAAIAVFFATINVVGGFLVTHRMLDMFRKK